LIYILDIFNAGVNEEKISGMSIGQMMAAGPTVMASAASQLLMYINMSVEDKEVFPHNQEVLNKMKEQYEKAKALAEKAWEDGDHEGSLYDQYYFEAGFLQV
jgi:hypothetical protein